MALLAVATLVSLKLSRPWIACSGDPHAGLMCAHLSQHVPVVKVCNHAILRLLGS